MPMEALFHAKDCTVKEVEESDLQDTLQVYRQVEDFLELGPLTKASMEMVLADINHFKESGGHFCVIVDRNGSKVGVVDFVPETTAGVAFLSLLMISLENRNKGIGKAVVFALESYLRQRYQTHTIESGVQVNNKLGIAFWKRCGFEIGQNAKVQHDGTVAYEMNKTLRDAPDSFTP